MNIFRLFDLNNICFLGLCLLNDLTRRVAEFGIKTIRKLACEEFLAAKYAMRIALKPSKGFCMFLFIFNGTLLIQKITKNRKKVI